MTNLTPIGNPNPIIDRNIHTTSTTQYNVSLLGPDIDSVNKHVYPYFDREGTHVANKIRAVREKGFFWEGNPSKAVENILLSPRENLTASRPIR